MLSSRGRAIHNIHHLLNNHQKNNVWRVGREGMMIVPSNTLLINKNQFHTKLVTHVQQQELRGETHHINNNSEDNTNDRRRRKPVSKLRRAFQVLLLGFLTSFAYSTYKDSQAIVASEHDVRDWEPELEKSMPLVFRSHVLRHLRDLTGKKEIMARIVDSFAPEMSPFKTPNVPEYRIDWIDPTSGKVLSGNEGFIELLKKCKLVSEIDYLRAPLCTNNFNSVNKNYDFIELLRVSHMVFRIPLQVTIEKRIDGKLVQHKIAGNYDLTLVKFDDVSRPDSSNPLLPARDDWYLLKSELVEVGSNVQVPHKKKSLVLHEELAPGNFRVVREGSKVLQYHKDEAVEYIERYYARLGPASLFTTKTTINKHAAKI